MRMPSQGALTVITPVQPGHLMDLHTLLTDLGDHIDPVTGVGLVKGQVFMRFRDLTTVHFLRWVILDPARDAEGNPIRPSLAFSTDHDGPLEAHVDELIEKIGPALNRIYSYCCNYTGPRQLKSFLHTHLTPHEAYYNGHPGRSRDQIAGTFNRSEAELRLIIENEIDNLPRDTPTEATINLLRKAVHRHGWRSAVSSGRPPEVKKFSPLLFIAFLILFPLLFLIVGIWALCLNVKDRVEHRREAGLQKKNPRLHPYWSSDPYVSDPSDGRIARITAQEDRRDFVQNQLSHVVNVKPGKFRLCTLRFILASINLLSQTIFVEGKLGNIPTIHFARWVLIDDNRRLLFFSNYDFTLKKYVGDFISLASDGLTSIWTNLTFFPRTRIHVLTALPRAVWIFMFQRYFPNLAKVLLFSGGARYEQEFTRWTRDHQIPTQVWYSAYPQLSVVNVNDNTKIANELFSHLEGERLNEWLRLL
jgi:hypothetical protein